VDDTVPPGTTDPETTGRPVFCGAPDDVTAAVLADVAVVLPPAFVAVTATSSESPRSLAWIE
jgi:hypothetical protein